MPENEAAALPDQLEDEIEAAEKAQVTELPIIEPAPLPLAPAPAPAPAFADVLSAGAASVIAAHTRQRDAKGAVANAVAMQTNAIATLADANGELADATRNRVSASISLRDLLTEDIERNK